MSLTRRTLLAGSWSAPVVLATTPIQAYAASAPTSTTSYHPTVATDSVTPALTYLHVSAEGFVTPSWGDWAYNTDSRGNHRVTLATYDAQMNPLSTPFALGSEAISIIRTYGTHAYATTCDPSNKPATGEIYANQSAYCTFDASTAQWVYHRMKTSMIHSLDIAADDTAVYVAGAIDDKAAIVRIEGDHEEVIMSHEGWPYGRVLSMVLLDGIFYFHMVGTGRNGLYTFDPTTGHTTYLGSHRAYDIWIIKGEPIAVLFDALYNMREQRIIGSLPEEFVVPISYTDGYRLFILLGSHLYEWSETTASAHLMATFTDQPARITAIAARGDTLYAGTATGQVGIYSLSSFR